MFLSCQRVKELTYCKISQFSAVPGDVVDLVDKLGVGFVVPVGDIRKITECHSNLLIYIRFKVGRTPIRVAVRNSTFSIHLKTVGTRFRFPASPAILGDLL